MSQDAVITYGSGESVTLKIKQGVYSVYTQEKQSLSSLVSDTSFITAEVASLKLSDYEKEQFTGDNPKVLINPVFEDGHGNIAHVDNKINLYMYEATTVIVLQKLLDANKLNLTVQEKFWREGQADTYHTVVINPPFKKRSIVELTNKVNELPGVKMAFPNLIHKITPSSSVHGITDTHYSNQWEHEKIKSELAWAITKGNANIRIGILDNGIDHDHDDLTDNIWRDGLGNVMGGDFTSDGFSTGRPYGDESHGTHCAGLAAASINNEGVVGAAPGVSLVPLKIATGQGGTGRSWQVDQTGFIDAMNYSIDNNIDVLSASFGLTWAGNISILNQAFEDVIDDGRNGKGIVFVTSVGNDGSDINIYDNISHRTEVITVGGTTLQDQRWPESSYDPNVPWLDIAAPTGWNPNDGVFNYTTDIEGSSGESSGDYVTYFGGTSGATPVVAGAAALLLSYDNTLTHQEVKDILYDGAEKVGGYSYSYSGGMSSELGHGRLNSFRSLAYALTLQYSNQNFSSSTTLSNSAHIYGSTSIGSSVTVTIPSNEVVVLRGTVNGASNSKIAANGKLIIESGAALNDVEVIIENGGELVANGEWGDLIKLDGEGLVFEDGSDGQITKCSIKNANRGVEINGSATPLVENCFITNHSTGVWVNSGVGSGAQILNNEINNNSTHGIASYYSSPTIEDNMVYNNSTYGFFGLGSTATFDGNQFNTSDYGLYLLNGSAVQNATGNYMIGIGNNAIHVESPVTVVVQYNDIIPTPGLDYLVRAKHDATVIASYNFYANSPSNYFYATDGAQITYTPQSFSNHTPYYSQSKIAQKATGQSADTSKAQSCEESYQQVSELLSGQSSGERSQRALLTAKAGCWRASGKPGFVEYLNTEVRPGLSKSSRLYATTLEMENLFLMDQGNYKQAIANYQTLRKNFADDPLLHQHALFGLGYIHSLVNKDTRAGGHYLAELQQRYPESSLAGQARSLAGAYSFKIARLSDYEGFEEVEQSPEELSLSNYPNPFNPVTKISYSLPERSQVSLVVYDMLGRQVAELVNQSQSAGSHSISFDASQLSSGIYLYRLHAGSKVVSGRMTLVK